jgi:hypothetical protein
MVEDEQYLTNRGISRAESSRKHAALSSPRSDRRLAAFANPDNKEVVPGREAPCLRTSVLFG